MKCGKKDAIDWGLKQTNFGRDKAEFVERLWSCISVGNQGEEDNHIFDDEGGGDLSYKRDWQG